MGRILWPVRSSRMDGVHALLRLQRRVASWTALEDESLGRLYSYLHAHKELGVWMVVDTATGEFVSQRQLPRMSLIVPELEIAEGYEASSAEDENEGGPVAAATAVVTLLIVTVGFAVVSSSIELTSAATPPALRKARRA